MSKRREIEDWYEEDFGSLSEQVGISGRHMPLGGNHYAILLSKFDYYCAAYLLNPRNILEEAGYGEIITADGYTRAQQEYVDSML